jgi:hypothetical protein
MSLPVQLALVVAVVALALVALTTVTGVLPQIGNAIGSVFGGIGDTVFATPSPVVTVQPPPDAPTLEPPDNPYTNKKTVTLNGTVPSGVIGKDGYVIRVYVALPDGEPQAAVEVPVGETSAFAAEIELGKGDNDVTATIVGPDGESEPSASVTYVLDTAKPKVTVTAPKDNARVNAPSVKITGKTQGGATVVARNEANGTAATTTARDDGSFSVKVTLSRGSNAISLTATDQAGNSGTAVITVRKGSGKLQVALTASQYRISAAKLPRTIELTAVVTDPDGRPVSGESVTFTLSIPGVPALTGDDRTDRNGVATFRTTIPEGATPGSGLATSFVSTREFGEASGRTSITIVK